MMTELDVRYGRLTARICRIGGLALLVVVLAAACTQAPQAPQPVATQEEPTAAGTDSQRPAQPAAEAAHPTATPDEGWDLLVIGDSTMWSVAPLYAAHIEQDLGVQVTPHTWIRGGLSSTFLRDALGWHEELRGLVQEAEVLAFIANPTEHTGWYIVGGGGHHDCSAEALAKYADDYGAIIESFRELRAGQPTILRGAQYYCPVYSLWKKQGDYEELQPCWSRLNEAIVDACTEHNVLVADVYSAFNGPDYDEDPGDKGYIGADGEHTTALGQEVIAQCLHELGYEYTVP